MASRIKLEYGLGAIEDFKDPRDHAYPDADLAGTPLVVASMPLVVDNRHLFGPVSDQGMEPTCVGATVVGSARLYYPDLEGSIRWAYDRAQEHDDVEGVGYPGTRLFGGYSGWGHDGLCSNKCQPYLPLMPTEPCEGAEAEALEAPLTRYVRLRNFSQVLDAIWRYKMAAITIMVHTGWIKPKNGRIRWQRNYTERGLHAVLLVGYNEHTRMLIVRNSWTERWGDVGHTEIGYKDYLAHVRDAWLPIVEG